MRKQPHNNTTPPFFLPRLLGPITPVQHGPLHCIHTCFFFQPKNTTDDKTRGIHNQVDCIQGVPYNSCPVRAVLTHMNRDRARNIRYPVHKKDIIDTPHYCNKT